MLSRMSRVHSKGVYPTALLGSDLHGVSLVIDKVSHELRFTHLFHVSLCNQTTLEICSCDMRMGEEPNAVYLDGGPCKIVATIRPVRNTQVFVDEQQYTEQAALPYGAFIINLPRVRPATEYVVEFSLFNEHNLECSRASYSLSMQQHAIQHSLGSRKKFSGVLLKKSSWKVISYFEELSDNGFSDRFMKDKARLEAFVQMNVGNQDLLALVLLTECDSLLLRGKIEDAILLAKQACQISSTHNCPNDLFIRAYAHVAFSARHRFNGDFEEADEQLSIAAMMFLQLEPSEYSCAFYYNIVACTMAKRAAGKELSAGDQRVSIEAYHLALEHWDRQTQIRNMRRPQRIHNRQISYLLKSRTKEAPNPSTVVSAENLSQAKKKLTYFKENYLDDSPAWPRILYYLNRTDYCLHTRDVAEGYKVCRLALDIAKNHGFERETRGAEHRLKSLEAMRRERQLAIPESSVGEGIPLQHPPGPSETYDVMRELMVDSSERCYEQLPVEETGGRGRVPMQHPRGPNGREDFVTELPVEYRVLIGSDFQMRVTEIWLAGRGPEEHPCDSEFGDQATSRLSW